jgi:hypothetical protein
MPEQYGYQWIDLDEYYHSVNGLNSTSGTPEEFQILENFEATPTRSRDTLPFMIYPKRFEVEIPILLCPDKMDTIG